MGLKLEILLDGAEKFGSIAAFIGCLKKMHEAPSVSFFFSLDTNSRIVRIDKKFLLIISGCSGAIKLTSEHIYMELHTHTEKERIPLA